MRQTITQNRDQGDPANTPFVRFDLGTMFPPNTLYESAEIFIKQLESQPFDETVEELVRSGPYKGQFGVLPEATWFHVLQRFFEYHEQTGLDRRESHEFCLTALKLMSQHPHEQCWPRLREFIVRNTDALSGWTGSIRKVLSERRGVLGEDGNYYIEDELSNRTQILGARTSAEDRLDFITSQLAMTSGSLHQFVALFSLFAIADDFTSHPEFYHRLIKASVTCTPFASLRSEWTFLHFQHSRTFRWRPYSNYCDPSWLIGDILGKLTDTLDTDFWHNPQSSLQADTQWLEDGLPFQMDYVLDTELVVGNDEYAYISFEGKVFRWINGTPERDATVSVTVRNLREHLEEDEKLNRFLSLLVWEHGQHARIKWGVGGGRTAHSKAYSVRRTGGVRVDPMYLHRNIGRTLSATQLVALGLYREAQNSSSTFYEFLSYYKILELVVPNRGKTARAKWLNEVAIPKLKHIERLREILLRHNDLETYLRDVQVNGIKHAIKGTIDADDPADQLATTKDNLLMREIATLLMREKLKL